MLFDFALLLIAVPLILIVIGYFTRSAFPLGAGGIGFIIVGVMLLASPITTMPCCDGAANTMETSLYWDDLCLQTVRVAAGDTLVYYATSVTPIGHTSVTGTLNNTYLNDQIYYTVREGAPGDFNITWNFTGLPNSACSLTFNGHYDGGGGHYVKCTIFNYTSGLYQNCDGAPADDFPNTVGHADYTRGWSYDGFLDFYDGGELSMRMQHVGGGVASHYMETDYLRMDCIATTYTIGESIVNCTHDSVNVTSIGNSTSASEAMTDNENLALGVLLIFVGLFCLVTGALSTRE